MLDFELYSANSVVGHQSDSHGLRSRGELEIWFALCMVAFFFLTRVCWCSDKLCSLTVVSLSWAHVLIPFIDSCWFLMQPCQRDWRSLPFNIGLHPCPSHAEMSPDSLNLLKIWTRNGKISEFLAVWLWEAVCLTVGPQNWSQSGGSEHFTTNACIYKNQGSWWDKILIIVSVSCFVSCNVVKKKEEMITFSL